MSENTAQLTTLKTPNTPWNTLTGEGGVHVLPKRHLKIPIPDQTKIKDTFGERRGKGIAQGLEDLTVFVRDGRPIADKFGSDHVSRRLWRERMVEKLGKTVFNELYENHNQLRENTLRAIMFIGDHLLSMVLDDRKMGSTMNELMAEIANAIDSHHPKTRVKDGLRYNERTLEEKLLVVQLVEDACIKILELFPHH